MLRKQVLSTNCLCTVRDNINILIKENNISAIIKIVLMSPCISLKGASEVPRGPWIILWESLIDQDSLEKIKATYLTYIYIFVILNYDGVLCLVAQLCPTLCNPMDCSPPGSSVHGDTLGKSTEMCCHALLPRDQTQVSHFAGRFFTIWATREAREHWSG